MFIVGSLLSFGLLLGFYIPKIHIHHPININIQGLSWEQKKAVSLYGETPLGRKIEVSRLALNGQNKTYVLYSKLFICFNQIPIDSISNISVQLGERKVLISKDAIQNWHTKNKLETDFLLSNYIKDDKEFTSKIDSLINVYISYFLVEFFLLVLMLAVYVMPILGFLYIFITRKKYIKQLDVNQSSRIVFLLCLFFYLAIQLYGIYFYQLRLQADAAGDMTWYSVCNGYIGNKYLPTFPGHLRFTYLLNKLVLTPSFALHFPITFIGRLYCINDALFHLFVAILIILLTKRYDYAATVLAVPILLLGANFYFIGTELFLSGSIMLLYLAVYKSMKASFLKNSILFSCLFFIVWSHPITLLMLTVFLVGIYTSIQQLRKDKWLLLFTLGNIVVRLYCLNSYDQHKLTELIVPLNWNYVFQICIDYVLTYWYLLFLTVVGVYIAYKRSQLFYYRGLFLTPLIVYLCISYQLQIGNATFQKHIYPLNLLLLTQGIVFVLSSKIQFKLIVYGFTILFLLFGMYSTISNHHRSFHTRALLYKSLNDICYKEDPQHSKWFVRAEMVKDFDQYSSFVETITFSAFYQLPTTNQIIRADTTLQKKILPFVPEQNYWICDSSSVNVNSLNPYYFHFKKGYYRELVLDSGKLQLLKRACDM